MEEIGFSHFCNGNGEFQVFFNLHSEDVAGMRFSEDGTGFPSQFMPLRVTGTPMGESR
jgi:hypothetical protein